MFSQAVEGSELVVTVQLAVRGGDGDQFVAALGVAGQVDVGVIRGDGNVGTISATTGGEEDGNAAGNQDVLHGWFPLAVLERFAV